MDGHGVAVSRVLEGEGKASSGISMSTQGASDVDNASLARDGVDSGVPRGETSTLREAGSCSLEIGEKHTEYLVDTMDPRFVLVREVKLWCAT